MSAGRTCPLSYRYHPAALRTLQPIETEVLYVVGGLYGNEAALATVLALYEGETGNKRLVFNGDFHWFDCDGAAFARVNTAVLAHVALRGNVETELASAGDPEQDGTTGCGCGYPDWIDDATVIQSNTIMRTLSKTAARHPAIQTKLRALPMMLRARVGTTDIGIVHGDAESLAGWGFAVERLSDAAHLATVRDWFEAADVRIFASSHTCEPVFRTIIDNAGLSCLIANNGAAGMPNNANQPFGIMTRISTTPAAEALYEVCVGGTYVAALPIAFDTTRWHRAFLQQWPRGTAAHAAYWERICWGFAVC
jgi:hypothetical protein